MVAPCYNEQAAVAEFYGRATAALAPLSEDYEILFVNDGSDDATPFLLNDLAAKDPHVKVLHLARNMGHQIALTAGLDFASGDRIIVIDCDLQDPPELAAQMLTKIDDGYDLVHAQRRERKGESWFKLATAKLFYLLMKRFAEESLVENCGDFRAFSRPVLEAAIAFREPHRFLRGLFSHVGFRQCVIQYDREARFAGATKYPFHKMLRLAINAALSFSSAPLRAISWASIMLWISSFVYLIHSLYTHYVLKTTAPGWTSVIFLMAFFTGLILFSIAILGSYIGRIFEQGQRRPLYWLSGVQNISDEDFNRVSSDAHEAHLSRRILLSAKDCERKRMAVAAVAHKSSPQPKS
ncbi:MAG: glycosyltransferase family 2 protein [Candidatus Sumerlaeota bacterium]|nr:glycosyltransferase family 2 protein [Candidatus Sumerlaeota bacterium]